MAGLLTASLTKQWSRFSGMAKKLFDTGGIQLNYFEKPWENGFLWNLYTYSMLLRLTHKKFHSLL